MTGVGITDIRLRVPARILFFFFQAEDGIRDYKVTGVQTCALPISANAIAASDVRRSPGLPATCPTLGTAAKSRAGARRLTSAGPDTCAGSSVPKIGRASCRERG